MIVFCQPSAEKTFIEENDSIGDRILARICHQVGMTLGNHSW